MKKLVGQWPGPGPASKPNHTYTNIGTHASVHAGYRLLQFFQTNRNKRAIDNSALLFSFFFLSKGSKWVKEYKFMESHATNLPITRYQNKTNEKKIAHTSVALVTAHGAHTCGPTIRNARSTNAFSLRFLTRFAFSLVSSAGCWWLCCISLTGCVFYFPFCASWSKCVPFIRLSPFLLIWQSTNL